jgi:hypothetical protein
MKKALKTAGKSILIILGLPVILEQPMSYVHLRKLTEIELVQLLIPEEAIILFILCLWIQE